MNMRFLACLALVLVQPVSSLAAEPEAAPPLPPSPVAASYRIGPGDTIQVFVWRNPDLTVTVPVKPDGRITTPLVEDMVAAGKTTVELARDIEKVLAQYVRTPQVNIIVTIPQGVLNQVRAVGQLKNPQAINYREGLTVLDVVIASGGLAEFAAGNRSKIVRTVNGKRTELKVRIKDIAEKGDLRTNVALLPGDVLFVPESRF